MVAVDPELLREAMKQANRDTPPGRLLRSPIGDDVRRWLRANLPHPELVRFIEAESWGESRQLCAGVMNCAAEIVSETERWKTLGSRFIVLGSAPNGDWIALPRDGLDTIGFVSHEEFGYDKTDLVKYVAVDTSIGRFYYGSWNVEGYPVDYYEGRRREHR